MAPRRKKRRLKPKTLLLSAASTRSVARLSAALAYTDETTPLEQEIRRRATAILRLLRDMA